MRSDKPWYVYFAVDPKHQRFKLGCSINPAQRLQGLPQYRLIDESKSFQCQCADEWTAKRLEGILKRWFDLESISSKEIGYGDGSTEWYVLSCLDDMLRFLHNHRIRLRCGTVEPLLFDALLEKLWKAMAKELGLRRPSEVSARWTRPAKGAKHGRTKQ